MQGLLDLIAARNPEQAGGLLSDLVAGPRNRLAGLLNDPSGFANDALQEGLFGPPEVRSARDKFWNKEPMTDLEKQAYTNQLLNMGMAGMTVTKGGSANLLDGEKAFLRFGEPPMSGKSKHVQHGYDEDGVSVIGQLADLGNIPFSQQMLFSMTAGEMGRRPLYVVAGKSRKHNPWVYGESGFGSDGEPLIDAARILREATPEERYLLVKNMQDVATKQFGFDEIPSLYKIFKAEKP